MEKNVYVIAKNLKIILILIFIISLTTILPLEATGQKAKSKTTDEAGITPYVAVDEMPMYPGGYPALAQFISRNIVYPDDAREKGIQGKVIIKFCVTAKGSISLVSILKSVDPDLDREAIRIVKTITTFIPGKKDGVPVPVWFMLPITFSLKTSN